MLTFSIKLLIIILLNVTLFLFKIPFIFLIYLLLSLRIGRILVCVFCCSDKILLNLWNNCPIFNLSWRIKILLSLIASIVFLSSSASRLIINWLLNSLLLSCCKFLSWLLLLKTQLLSLFLRNYFWIIACWIFSLSTLLLLRNRQSVNNFSWTIICDFFYTLISNILISWLTSNIYGSFHLSILIFQTRILLLKSSSILLLIYCLSLKCSFILNLAWRVF